MWASLLVRFWKPLIGAALLIGAAMFLHYRGYESGYAASEAHWQPKFAEAERARDAANLKAERQTARSILLSQTAEAEHAKIVSSLNLRATDAERRYASILRQHSADSSRCSVSQDGGATSGADATRSSSELIDRASRDFASLARRCESDSAALTSLQEWVRSQQALSAQ